MTVIADDPDPVEGEEIEAPWRAGPAGRKALQTEADELQRHTQPPGRRRRRQDVLDLEADRPAMDQRHAVEMRQARLPRAVAEDDPAVADGRRQAPLRQMLDHQGEIGVEREVNDLARAPLLHVDDERIGGVEHRGTRFAHRVDDCPLHPSELLGGIDIGHAEMVARADIRDDADVAGIEAAALAEDAAAGRLEDRRGDRRVGEHAASALRTAAITAVDLPPPHPDPLGAGRADGSAADRGDVGEKTDDRRLAIGAGHRRNGDPTVIPRREERVDDRGPDIARLANGRLQMHPQAGAGVDLNEHPPLQLQWPGDVGRHAIDAGDIEADDPRRLDRPGSDLRVDDVGDILGGSAGGEIGVAPQHYGLTVGRDHPDIEPLVTEHRQRYLVKGHGAQAAGVVAAPPRVLINGIDELAHRRPPIADDRRQMAPRRGHQRPADNEQPVVVPMAGALDDDRRLLLAGHLPALLDLLARRKIDRDTAPLIAVARLDDNRGADLLRRRPGVGRVGHRPPLGDGNPRLGEELPGQFLVLGDRFSDRAGAVALRGDDPSLLSPDAEPDHRAGGEPAVGNAAGRGGLDDRPGAGPELDFEEERAEATDLGGDVEGIARDGAADEAVGGVEAFDREGLLLIFDHDPVDAGGRGLAGPAVPHDGPGERLQLDRHVLEDMPHPGAGAEPLEESAPGADRAAVLDHRRQPLHDPLVETGKRVGGKLLQPAEVDGRLDDREPCPLVRTAQNPDRRDLHGWACDFRPRRRRVRRLVGGASLPGHRTFRRPLWEEAAPIAGFRAGASPDQSGW